MKEAGSIREGQPAPDFQLRDLEGNPHSLPDYRGRPLLLIFLRHTG
jgi:peroxiredoxin